MDRSNSMSSRESSNDEDTAMMSVSSSTTCVGGVLAASVRARLHQHTNLVTDVVFVPFFQRISRFSNLYIQFQKCLKCCS